MQILYQLSVYEKKSFVLEKELEDFGTMKTAKEKRSLVVKGKCDKRNCSCLQGNKCMSIEKIEDFCFTFCTRKV